MTLVAPDVTEQLIERAAGGDRRAWDELVELYSGLVWSVTRQFRLNDADAADVTQTTWLRLLEHLHRLREPSRVGAWLATTARRECLRTVAQHKRLVLTSNDATFERMDTGAEDVDAKMLAAEQSVSVNEALARLPQRWREIMTLLAADPPASYEEISVKLEVPIGSIGPTRGRCLRRLQSMLDG